MGQFIPGLDLNRHFFQQIVKPLIDEHFPGLEYAAGLVGDGSDVVGFDTPQSMDHNWGPHIRIFLSDDDFKTKKDAIDDMFRQKLPYEFMGFPTNYTKPNENTYLVQQMKPLNKGPINHMIQFYTVRSFFQHYLGLDPYRRLTYKDWLIFPQQALLEISRGQIYYDKIGFEKIRQKFAYYPKNIWQYMYMIQWGKLAEEQAFMGRTGEVGGELGSNIIATDTINNIMRLCFLIEKRYMPYIKWFGTAFSRLKCASELTHPLLRVIHGDNWTAREESMEQVYEIVLRLHNELGLTKPIKMDFKDYHGRPYKTVRADLIYEEIKKGLADKRLANIHYPLGSVDQFIYHPRINHMDYVYWQLKPLIK